VLAAGRGRDARQATAASGSRNSLHRAPITRRPAKRRLGPGSAI